MYRRIGSILLMILLSCSFLLSAEKSLERLANEAGVEGETFYNNGKFLDAAKAFEDAVGKLKEAVKTEGIPLDNEKIARWLEYAFNAYYQGNDFENSIRILDERLKLKSGDYDLVNYKAIILKGKLNRTADAIEVLKAFNEGNRTFKVESKIADYYIDLDDKENALTWFNRAYELKKDSKIIRNIATLNVQLGRNEDAVKAYEDFIQTNPKESVLVQTYKNMGKLYEDMGSYAKANVYYEKSLALSYDNTVNLLLIVSYYDHDDFSKAMEKINQMLQKNPGSADAIYYRAMIKYNQEDKAGAKADFQKILNSKYSSSAKKFIESIDSEL